jgi:hypothetical protein
MFGSVALVAGMTCAYTCSVMVAEAWPSRSDTTLTGTPLASTACGEALDQVLIDAGFTDHGELGQ